MPESENPAPDPAADAPLHHLPPVAPDVAEQEHGTLGPDGFPLGGDGLPIVGLGASAGGIPALQEFFQLMPPESGMAFVVVMHLSPERESALAETLQRVTTMQVHQATDGAKLEANTVYVIPPARHLTAVDGVLRLAELPRDLGKRVAVDLFFRSLADCQGANATAIVLSGADGDGSIGLKRIKERGGLTIAQAPDEAEHPGMPRTAIATGMVDWVLPVSQMPGRLLEYRDRRDRIELPPEEDPSPPAAAPAPAADHEQALRAVLAFLRAQTGRDFLTYKRATILRRLARRMQVNGVFTLTEYLDFLRLHTGEASALLQDLLISVTNFFRDRDAFAALEQVIPGMFAGKAEGDAVRIWVAGCASGEEAYSIAMLLLEHASLLESPPSIQVFATDLNVEVVAAARQGHYPHTIEADVSEERLRRFFTREHHGYTVRRELRECVLFAVHDLLKDSPFSKLDLVSCRNLLIYLNREAQQQALELFHFGLRPGARLFLGSAEAVDEKSVLFQALDKKHRLFKKAELAGRAPLLQTGPGVLARSREPQDRAARALRMHTPAFARTAALTARRDLELTEARVPSLEELHFKLIERFAPPSLIVDRDYSIIHVSENAGRFLHFAGGEPSTNLMRAVHPMLRVELRAALFRAAQTNAPVEVFRVPLELEGRPAEVDIRVSPSQEIARDYLLVVFIPREGADPARDAVAAGAEPAVRELERENEQMKARLQDTVEQYEASLEELKASNEELQAMNEELCSSGEELETGREELQSVNEELTTVNQELKSKVDQLGHANSDLSNLMAATAIATIFVDRQLRIMRYTPSAVALFRLLPGDVGRPLSDLTHGLDYPELPADANRAIEALAPVRREVSDSHGRWYLVQLLPYRTTDDYIAGAVLTFVDITESKRAELARLEIAAELERQARTFDTALSSIADFAYTFDREGRFIYANRPLRDLLGLTMNEMEGRTFAQLGYPPELAARLQRQIEHVVATSETVVDETPFTNPEGKLGYYEYIFQPVVGADGSVEVVAGSTRVITERKLAEAALRESEERLRFATEAADMYSWEFDPATLQTQYAENAERVLGFSLPSDVQAMIALIHPDDRGEVSEIFEKAFKERTPFQAEFRLVHPRTRQVIWQSSHALLIERDGAPRFVGITQNISARKQAEEALRETQERLRLAQEAGEVGIWDWNVATGESYWSETLWRIFGYTDPAGLDPAVVWKKHLLPEDRARVDSLLGRLLASSAIEFRSEFRICCVDRRIRWLESVARITRDEDGRPLRMMGVNFEVTERKEADAALRSSEERLRLIVENAREYAIFSLDLERRITSWNRGAQTILGYTQEEAIGQPGDIIFVEEDRAAGAPEEEARKALAEGRAADERWHVRKDGSRFWGSGVMMAMHNAQGEAIGLVKIFRDQTAEREANEALERGRHELWVALQENELARAEAEKARAEAEAAASAKDHFLAVLSHELRTPLTPVLMGLRTLGRTRDLPPAARETFAMIQRNVELEAHFIDDLLDVTRISRGKMEIVPELIDLHDVARRSVEVAHPDMEAKNQRIAVELGAADHRLQGDPKRLQQALWNLLKNASKFSPEGSEIRLSSRNEPAAGDEPRHIVLEVVDRGVGFEPDAADRIFDAFAQAHEGISREFGGLGLGLSIAKATVEAHGGKVGAESAGLGKGATFRISLPLGGEVSGV
jgi:two-component system CheB/CheR fusion protein